ncbi:hypothetical protein V1523DRAFT_48518 [Lipomyces doorenjongii]
MYISVALNYCSALCKIMPATFSTCRRATRVSLIASSPVPATVVTNAISLFLVLPLVTGNSSSSGFGPSRPSTALCVITPLLSYSPIVIAVVVPILTRRASWAFEINVWESVMSATSLSGCDAVVRTVAARASERCEVIAGERGTFWNRASIGEVILFIC